MRLTARSPCQKRKLSLKGKLSNASASAGSAVVGVAGFEPANDGVKVRCLTAWLYPSEQVLV